MANNKIQLATGLVLLDLTSDTVDAGHLASGYTAHDRSGAIITGTMNVPTATDAVLIATVPANSTVTMARGQTSLTPTLWTTAADSSRECALFVIPSALFDSQNAWTVTATSGNKTASESLIVDSAVQYELYLTYWNGIFYDNGDEYSDFTGGWSKVSAQGSITKNATNIFITATSNSVAASGAASTAGGFNLAHYSTLYFTITATGTYYSRIGLTNTQGGYLDDAWVSGCYQEFTSKGSQVTVSIDISGLSYGIYYPTIRTRATSAGLRLYKAWVE